MAKPKSGDTYTTGDEPIGNDAFAIPPRTKVTVREVVAADTAGAHDDSEDAVVVEATVYGLPRAWSVGLDQFASDYTKV